MSDPILNVSTALRVDDPDEHSLRVEYQPLEVVTLSEMAARESVRALAGEIRIRRTGLPYQKLYFYERTLQLEMALELHLMDRDDPSKTARVTFLSSLSWMEIAISNASRVVVLGALRRLLHSAMMHEADECLFFRGVRVNDPHGGEPRRVFSPAFSEKP